MTLYESSPARAFNALWHRGHVKKAALQARRLTAQISYEHD